MNRVYKVIWSKAKHCYVVTSEIARSVTKSASSARSAGRKGAAVLAMAALLFTAGGVLGEAANVTGITVNEPGNVITVTKDDGKAPDTITINNVDNAKAADYAIKATSDGSGHVIENTYVKNVDARVGADGNYVKTDKKVGENLSALDTQVKANADAVAAEETARKEADKGNLKVDPDGVISKVSNDDGSQPDSVNKLVLNVEGNNRITMDENGIKVGKNSTVIASDGVFAGGDTADAAKAALNANGSIKGANGKFTVDTNGLVTANGGVDTNSGDILTRGGKINAGSGDISGKDISASGDISGKDITGFGTVKGHAVTDGTARMEGGALTGVTTITAGGDVVSTGGKVQGTSVSDGTATLSGGSLNNAVDINASGTITGNNVVVKGKLTTNGLETDRITLGSETLNQTDINKGNVTSKVNDTVGAVEYTAESIFNKDGSSITARTDEGIVDSTGKSIVGAKEISQYLGNNAEPKSSDKNVTRNMVRNDDGTFSMEDKAVDEGNSSTVRQNAGERTVTVTDGENTASTNLTAADIKNTAENGMISNTAKNLVNTATENMTNTVGGNLTTTVTGDSSLTAENITNEAKNRITNKAIDVETDATSSIVQKVTNDAGSNTSTQWSYQTLEEMSQADGKTASYLRGAAEEKSQLTDGDKKTTIDTVAGQTNTNITDGTNTSNDLQKADQIASSVTKGTNKTVVNQDAVSLASSITDGTKVNNTNNTVDKSEQLIKADDTHFYAETRTAGSAVEALKSDGNTIISAKDAVTGTVSSAVTDGTNTTGSSMTANGITNSAAESIVNEIGDGSAVKSEMTAHGITNTAKDGTITNDAKDLVNTASNSITDKVGENVERTMGTKKIEESVKDGTKSNTFTKTAKKDMNIITDGTNTSTLSQLADKVNTSLKEVDGAGNTTKSLNNVKTVSEDTTKMTDAASGEFSKRSQTVSQIQDKVGKTTVTTTDGLTKLTDEDHNHTTEMDYANVTKDLSVERNTTLGKKGEDTNLTVNSKSEFKDTVKMDSTLEVDGTSKFNNKVTITKNGLDVTGGTTTDKLEVKGASEFGGKAAFKDDVSMDKKLTVKGAAGFKDDVSMGKNLTVTGKTETGTLHVNGNGYVGGDLNVEGNIETHDAELSETSRQVVTGRQLYQTNERVDRLDNRIKKVGANAAALAALRPGDFNPDDKFSIAAGFGSYRNANAAALGLFYRPNENVLLSLGTSFGDGENMVNAGVSVKFGRGKSMAERRKEMADEVSSMRDEMRSQDERIAELEEMLKKQSELIEKLSKES
ncbi:ESPR-type extended signal peptide-containing protein [uncultured Dialister sp.]|uniref:ESPR-type extended signal peptide-containing protein n=1 Tax=uncultured Dialister sp. TaxID=278064 RepID=UPI00265A0529|nr:ESPR-type extended signal peptide-containing protein [uncultured Dialister sp.]